MEGERERKRERWRGRERAIEGERESAREEKRGAYIALQSGAVLNGTPCGCVTARFVRGAASSL
jgi:hypothetical protein